MKDYRGQITIETGTQWAHVDIDPPEREGYANVVRTANFIIDGDDTANTGKRLFVGVSIKSSGRSSYDHKPDGLALDLLGIGTPNFNTDISRTFSLDGNESGEFIVLGEPYFQDSMRLFAKAPVAVAALKAITLSYSFTVDEVKLTTSILNQINTRCFS